MSKVSKRTVLASLLLVMALCLGTLIGLPTGAVAEDSVVKASSIWSLTGGSDVIFDEGGQSRTMNAYTAENDQLYPASFVADERYGMVLAPGSTVNNKWGDQSCPWYLDINEVQISLSIWVNMPASSLAAETGQVAGVLFSDLITNFDNGATNFSWTLWVLDNGDLAFTTYDWETDEWGGGWTFGKLTADTWQQVAICFDVRYGKLFVYVDGELRGPSIGDGNGISVALPAGTKLMKEIGDRDMVDGTVKYRGFQIGQDGARGRALFPGKLADARLYMGHVLTAEEVQAAYHAEKDSPQATSLTLAAGYDFTEADYAYNNGKEIQIIDDRSGNKNYMISNPDTEWVTDETFGHVRESKSWAYNLETPLNLDQGFTVSLTAKGNTLDPFTFLLTNLIPTVNVSTQENSYTKTFDLHINGEGRVGFEINDGADGMWYSVTGPNSTDTFPLNRWVNLIVTYDAETNIIASYVDGILKNLAVMDLASKWNEVDIESGICVGGNAQQLIGQTGYTQAFNGQIANVRFYEHSVNQAAARAIFAGQDGALQTSVSYDVAETLPSEHLTGAYNMDEGAGEVLHDLSASPKHFILGTGTNWIQNLTEGKDQEWVVAPGYAVANKSFDLTEAFSVSAYLAISPAHNGFGIVLSGMSESRPHELGYLGKDFYIESNPAIWNVQINSIGRLCFEDQGAWDLNLIEVPYMAVPQKGDYWLHFAMTVEQQNANRFIFKFYFDGQLVHVAYKTIGVGSPEPGDRTVVLANQTASNNLQGYVCELRMYDTVLTKEEVRRQMAGDGLTTPEDLTEGTVYQSKEFEPGTYRVGEEVTIDLKEYFTNKSVETVTYSAVDASGTAIGTVEDGVFTWTPTTAGDQRVTFIAHADLQSARMDVTLTVEGETQDPGGSNSCNGCGGSAAGTGLTGVILLAAAAVLLAKRIKD